MIKSITFQGNRKFAANLYALEIKSRFIDQTHADGYYSGYGAELEAKVVGNQIQIGTGAFVVQGRISEVVSTEVVTPTIYGNCVGYVVARIETYHVSDDNNCTFKAYVNTALSEIPLRQDDVYATNADNENLVYELPIYSFEIKDRTIVNLQKLIKPIDDYARVQKEVDQIVKSTNEALALVQSATESSEQATMSADNAVKKSDSAFRLATEAKTTADSLADSIAQANETAQQAVSTANGAVEDIAKYKSDTDADIAQFKQSVNEEIADITATANGAVDTANEAKATADGLAESIAQANTTASEAKEIAEEALEQSKVTGTKVNVDGAFQSDLNFDSNPQEQLNDLKSADTALQNSKVNKSGDTMTGRLYMAGNAEIWNGNDSTFIEIGKVGQSGFEFHSQSNPDVYRNYDALIQSYEAQSETQDGSAAIRYIAREHNFSGGGIFENGQRVYSANNLPSSLFIQDTRNTDEFNEDIFPERRLVPFFTNVNMPTVNWYSGISVRGWTGGNYKTWQLVGDSSNDTAYERPLYVREVDPTNKTAKGWRALLSVDTSKLEPTTANGWTVGDKNLALSMDGIFLVSVTTLNGEISQYGGMSFIMFLRSIELLGIKNYYGVGLTGDNASAVSRPIVVIYTGFEQNGKRTGSWSAKKLDNSNSDIVSVAYKKIA